MGKISKPPDIYIYIYMYKQHIYHIPSSKKNKYFIFEIVFIRAHHSINQGSHRLWKTWKKALKEEEEEKKKKKNPCIEKSWNLKIKEKSCNFGMRLLFGCKYHSNFSRPLSSLRELILISNRTIQNHLLLQHKTGFFFFTQLLIQYNYFAFYTA